MSERRLHTCNLCEAVCGVVLEVDGGAVTGVRGDRDDPFSRGHVCPKAAALGDLARDPDRVRSPMRRTGARWEMISWADAIDEFATEIDRIRARYGPRSIGLYLGNPVVHSHTALLAVPFFARALGSRSKFSATSSDQLPHMLASLAMFGHQLMLPIPDLDRCAHLWILGANPLASNGSLMTAGDVRGRLGAIRSRGGRITVFDPRRTETAERADEHVFVRPGGDAFLLLGVLHTLFAEGLCRPGRLREFTRGLPELEAIAARFPPSRVAARCGVIATDIERLARALAASPRAAVYGRLGVCTQAYGGLSAWLVHALNVVIGALDHEGGMMFATPAADLLGLATGLGQTGHFRRFTSRVRGLPEFGGELPSAALAEEIDTPGDGQIRALVTLAGNPVLSTPDGARLARALPNLEFMASVDIYRNETTRHARLILPTSVGVERDHYDLAFYQLAVRNAARYARAAVAPPPGVMHDYDLLLALASALHERRGTVRGRAESLALRAARRAGPRPVLDLLLRAGPYGTLRGGRLSLRALEESPHGVDLGPLTPRLPGLLKTPDRRIDLVPEVFAQDLPRLERALDAPEEPSLVLIGRRDLRSNNSWMHNLPRLAKGNRARCTLRMHPEDATARGLAEGDAVRLASRVGAVTVPLEVTDELARGVVSLPHGWGHSEAADGLRVAGENPGASANDVTDGAFLDGLSANAGFSGVPVTVNRA
jgi:anaerobic selenocysteine-containing dehydrogenase